MGKVKMIASLDATTFWIGVCILAGLVLILLWWHKPREKSLGRDRSLRPGDSEVPDRVLLEDQAGLLIALRQFAQHMKVVYGLEVEVQPRGQHHVEEEGQRVLLFEVVMDLLLYLARCARLEKVRIVLGRQNDYHMVQLESEREINFATPSNDTSGKRASDYDVLAHIRERLYQIEGHLQVEPDCRHARRIILISTIETV